MIVQVGVCVLEIREQTCFRSLLTWKLLAITAWWAPLPVANDVCYGDRDLFYVDVRAALLLHPVQVGVRGVSENRP